MDTDNNTELANCCVNNGYSKDHLVRAPISCI